MAMPQYLEGDFSINKELLIDNMLEETVVAQRVVFDAIQNAGMDMKNVNIYRHAMSIA